MLFKTFGRLMAAITALVLCAVSTLIAAPRISFDSESIDLGRVVAGKPINAVFTFKNVGDTELEITAVRSSCGCTKAVAKETKLAPQQSSTINTVFNTSGYNGNVSKIVSITTNDPERGNITLSFKAEVIPLATLKPERLNFGSIKVNQSRTHRLFVYPGDVKTFTITKVIPSAHASAPSYKKITDKTGDYWELTVLVKAGSDPGRIMEWLDIVAGSDENQKARVMVYGNIVE